MFKPLVRVTKWNRDFRIYTPEPSEYIITINVLQKVIELGRNTISFPTTWCRAAKEAVAYGRDHEVDLMPHGRFFALLSE